MLVRDTKNLPPPRVRLAPEEIAQKRALLRHLEMTLKRKEAANDLIKFMELLMPSPSDPHNPEETRYDAQPYHRALANALEAVERGDIPKLIICMPPRHGKSEMASKAFPAWFVGRDPYRHVMVASYNQPFADEFGKKVRDIMQSETFTSVFPNCVLKKGSMSVDRLQTENGGVLAFVGRGGSITGRGADLFIIDDPLKNSKEADSELIRNELWEWFTSDVSTRKMHDNAPMIIIMTRWHEDDIVGRITDETNPHYNEDEAKTWKIINIPALCEDEDLDVEKQLGRKNGEPLWPFTWKVINGVKTRVAKFTREGLLSEQRKNPRKFLALYQQRPTALDGDLFKDDMFVTYTSRGEIPKRLRIYAASDHAVAEKQNNDYTVIIIIGVDEHDQIWVLDMWRERKAADKVVEKMIDYMAKWKPIIWYAEREHVVKTIGPFLKKRMRERKVHCYIKDMSAHTSDKVGKAQPLIGRMAMRMVLFPKFMPWFETLRAEFLKFPRARHDDMVDALGLIGRALDKLATAAPPKSEVKEPEAGTWGYFQADRKRREREQTRTRNLRGM